MALVSAFFGAQIALRRFYRERWWERKAEAYTSLIQTVFDVLCSLEPPPPGAQVVELPPPFYGSIQDRQRVRMKAALEIERAYALGGLLYSHEAVDGLRTLARDLSILEGTDPDRQRERSAAMIVRTRASLERLKRAAARDLRLSDPRRASAPK